MIDLTRKDLPNTVEVDGRSYLLNTDFRVWIQFERDMKESYRNGGMPFSVAYLFAEEPPQMDIDITAELKAWSNPPKELPRPINGSDAIALDLDIDADLIYAAFMEQYHIDLLTADMHWYQFCALLGSVSDKTHLGQVMGYRCYEKADGKEDVREKLRRAWEIQPPISAEEQAQIDEFNAYFEEV